MTERWKLGDPARVLEREQEERARRAARQEQERVQASARQPDRYELMARRAEIRESVKRALRGKR